MIDNFGHATTFLSRAGIAFVFASQMRGYRRPPPSGRLHWHNAPRFRDRKR
jgi:hypothetical protein